MQYIWRMDNFTTYTTAITPLIPFFSAIACGILVAFSLQDCLKHEELKLKKIILFYLFISGIGWFVTFCYEFSPMLFVWLNIVCLISYISSSLFFYRIIRYLTRLGQDEHFSKMHYLLPGILTVVMLTWSLFIPFDVQLKIVTGKAQVFPDGYEIFAHFYTIKPLLRVIFGLTYYTLSIKVLMNYYNRATRNRTIKRQPAQWLFFLIGISLASLFSSVLPTFMPRGEILYSVWTLIVALSITVQHVLLSYHIIRRDYSPYIIKAVANKQPQTITSTPEPTKPTEKPKEGTEEPKVETEKPTEESIDTTRRRQYTGKLNRKIFESFMRKEKPYLNPDYKMTNLVDDLDVNRTTLSEFVNRTYGMNFNRYLNRMRLEELRKLRALPANMGKSMKSLADMAGFKDYRNYSRAATAELKAEAEQKATEEQKSPEEQVAASEKKKRAYKKKGDKA